MRYVLGILVALSMVGCSAHGYKHEVAPDLVVLEVSHGNRVKGRYDPGDFGFVAIQSMAALACASASITNYAETQARNGDRLVEAQCNGVAAYDPGSELTFLWRDADSVDLLALVSQDGQRWRFRRILPIAPL